MQLYDPLYQFEMIFCDADGGTAKLECQLKRGVNVLKGQPEEVIKKYRHLMHLYDPTYPSSLRRFENEYVGHSGDTLLLKLVLSMGKNVLEGQPDEVKAKYGHLMYLYETSPL